MTPKPKFTHAGLDWIPHTPGDPMPCPPDAMVRVLFQAEQTHKTEYRPRYDMAKAYWWDDCRESSIVGWHPIEEQPEWPNAYTTVETGILRRVLDLLETGDIEQAKHELRKELE